MSCLCCYDFLPWHFVIEIYQLEQKFYPKVYRWESFLLMATASDLVVCEEKIRVKDEFSALEDMVFDNKISVKNHVIALLQQRLEL